MAKYKVQQQNWKHWPKVLVVEQWDEYGLAFGRYVPDAGTCEVEGSIIDTYEYNRWEYDLSCGHTIIWESSEPPNYCPECGKRVVE